MPCVLSRTAFVEVGESNPLGAISLWLVTTYLRWSRRVFDPPLVAFHDHRWPVLRALAPLLRPRGLVSLELQSNAKRDDSVPARHRYGPGYEGCAMSMRQLQLSPWRCSRVLGNTGSPTRTSAMPTTMRSLPSRHRTSRMYVGPDGAGRLFEIGVLSDADDDFVIHAMSARPKYLKLIESTRRDNS